MRSNRLLKQSMQLVDRRMTIESKPSADVTVDTALVRALLHEQHQDLAGLPLAETAAGWDNHLFRLGDALAVRLPRRALAANLIVHEQRWLPLLAARLPLPIPVPVRTGHPGCGFPWSWSVVPWLDGTSASVVPLPDPAVNAVDLGQFLRALHQPAPAEAPYNPWRGVPLAERTGSVLDRVKQLSDRVDSARIVAAWNEMVRTPRWQGPALWLHGDLHPGNLLIRDVHISAVLDFGDLTSGDPATDLAIAWMVLPPSARPTFRASARSAFNPIDDDMWVRARGWALTLGLVYLANSQDDPLLDAVGQATIHAVLNDD
jgi:aminoglycoside phosphotransferase (APT) family kinase protein